MMQSDRTELISIAAGGHKCVQQSSAQSLKVLTNEPQYYTFDAVAGESTDQAALFKGEQPRRCKQSPAQFCTYLHG